VNRVVGFETPNPASRQGSPQASPTAEMKLPTPFHNDDASSEIDSIFAEAKISGDAAPSGLLGQQPSVSPPSGQSSALTTQLQEAIFETQMHRLKSLRTSINTRKMAHSLPRHTRTQSDQRLMGSPGSASTAMPIPLISRACTSPEQLPELTQSMIESLLSEHGSPEKKENTTTPELREDRRKNAAGKRVPSARFLDDLNIIKARQESAFDMVGMKNRSASLRLT